MAIGFDVVGAETVLKEVVGHVAIVKPALGTYPASKLAYRTLSYCVVVGLALFLVRCSSVRRRVTNCMHASSVRPSFARRRGPPLVSCHN